MKDMKSQRIAEILKSGAEDTDIVVKGWVRTKRGNKNVAFIALNDGSCVANIQIDIISAGSTISAWMIVQ